MKRLFIALLIITVCIAFAGEITKTLRFPKHLLSITEKDGYSIVNYANAPEIDRVGVPSIPVLPYSVVIPPSATVTHIEIISKDEELLPGEYLLYPVQIGRKWSLDDPEPPFVEPNPEIYNSSELFPEENVEYMHTGSKAGYRIGGFVVYPVRYLPKERKVYFCSRMRVKVHYKEGMVRPIRKTSQQLAIFGSDVRLMVLNPNDVKRFAPPERKNPAFSLFLPPGYYEHVIITPQAYVDSLEKLRYWRTKQGIPSIIMTIENIQSTYTGRDLAEKMRNFIKDADTTWGSIFFFIARLDYPARQFRNVYCASTGTRGDTFPGDIYYSDLDRSWDCNNNNKFGECPADSIDGYSDVYVGMITFDPGSLIEISRYLNKLFRYEKTPGADYVRKTLLPVGVTFSQNFNDSIAEATPTGWFNCKMYMQGGMITPTPGRFCDSLDSGYGYTSVIAHGTVNSMSLGGSVTSDSMLGLTNTNKLNVLTAVSCHPGAWDSTGATNGDCMAENMVTHAPNGFVAVMMNARSGWVRVAEYYNYMFFYKLLPYGPPACSNYYYVGQALGRSKDHWIPLWNMQGIGRDSSRFRYEAYERNLFGDPAIVCWTDEPATANASFPAVITIGNNVPVTVTVTNSDAPIESALVCLWKGNETYAKGRTDNTGQITLYVSPRTPGPMDLTVTAHNYYVLEDSIQVISTARYVAYLKHTIDDAPPGGNGDGILNPGEHVELPMWVKNWGQQTAESVTGKFVTRDTLASATDSVKTFGNIGAGDSAYTGSNGYNLKVDSGLPNGYTIRCSLYCKDVNDSVWISLVNIGVGVPILQFAAKAIDDSATGNNNGKIDPGETVELIVTLKNTGMGNGYNVNAVLRSGDTLLTVDDSIGTFGNIPHGDSANNDVDRFVITASSSILLETSIPCTLHIYADGGYSFVQSFKVIVGEIRACDPIPDGPREPPLYWAYDNVDTFYTECPTYNWVEISGIGTRLDFPQNDAVINVSLPSGFGPFKYYGNRYNSVSISADGWVVAGNYTTGDYSNSRIPDTDGPPAMIAANWDDLYPQYGGTGYVYHYHDAANHRFIVEYDSVAYYLQRTIRDKFEVIIYDTTVSSQTGDNVILIQYKSANGYTSSTVGIEDPTETIGICCLFDDSYHRGAAPIVAGKAIKYTTVEPSPVGIRELTYSQTLASDVPFAIYPNLFKDICQIRYLIKQEGEVSLKIYNISGRIIRNLVNSNLKPNTYTVYWDGIDDKGMRVSNGIYFCRIKTGDYTSKQKMILLR